MSEIQTLDYSIEHMISYNLFETFCTTLKPPYVVFDSMYNPKTQNYIETSESNSNPHTNCQVFELHRPPIIRTTMNNIIKRRMHQKISSRSKSYILTNIVCD